MIDCGRSATCCIEATVGVPVAQMPHNSINATVL